jgi:hypothetical protein
MAAFQPLLARVIPLPATIEVKHPQRVIGALGVPLHHRMPATATRAVEEITRLQRLHAISMRKPQDNPGQRSINSDWR